MSFQIIYGRSGSGKTEYIFNQICNTINNGRKKYIITPEQFSLTAEKELLNNLKEKLDSSATISAEVLTFARMAHRVSTEVGGITNTILSNSGRSMILYRILSNKNNELKFLNKSDSNIDLILNQITELKKHGVSTDNLNEIINKTDDKYLKEKLIDIYKVYDQYNEKIASNYIDESDDLTRLIEQLDKTNMFDDCEIYIDEFAGFTKQEYMVIEKLMKVAYKVTILMCTDNINIGVNPDVDVFYSNKQALNKLIKIAKDNNIEIEKEILLNEIKRGKNKELTHIEENLFNIKYIKYMEQLQNVKLFLANNQYSEIEHVANEIIKLVRDENYKFNEISIITQNIGAYSNICKAILSSYNIPVYIDNKKDLKDNVLVKYIISILDVLAKNWSTNTVLNYLKTGLTNIEENDIFLIEKYVKKWNIRGNKWYKEDWNFRDEEEIGKDNLIRINKAREELTIPLLKLKEGLSKKNTAKQISKNLYDFLLSNKIDEKIEAIIKSLIDYGDIDTASQYETSWKVIINALDEMVMAFGDEIISFEDYAKVIQIGFNHSELGSLPMMMNEVLLGDIDRSRSHRVKAVFVIGLNDGSFPSINNSEGFLNDKDRDKIKEYGVELAKGTLEQIYDQNFNIYKVFTLPEEKLFLSYAASTSDGKSLRGSMILNRMKKIMPELKEDSDVVKKTVEFNSKLETYGNLLEEIKKYENGQQVDEVWFDIYNIFANDKEWQEKLKYTLELINIKNKDNQILDNSINKMYGNVLKTSVSRLEQYKRCPFSYFVKYGLKLNERDISKIETLDTGSFMHDIIDSFFSYTDENKLQIKEIEEKQISEIIETIINEKLKLDRNYIFISNEKNKRLVYRLKKVITTSMKYIIESLKQSDFNVYGHEVEFGDKNKYKPISFSTQSGKTVEIVGKIDRIDIAKNKDGTYIRIIDYKSSIKNIDLNKVVAGLQIQLITYLNEACKVEDFLPAGVLYFDLADPTISTSKNMSDEEIEEEIKKKFRMTGLVLADVNIMRMMDNKIDETKTSHIVPGGITSSGEISKSQSLISKSQFKNLQKYTDKIIKEISEEILKGNIQAKPYYDMKAKKGKVPCEYCKYKSICRFDENEKNNEYNYLESLKQEDVLEKINEEN